MILAHCSLIALAPVLLSLGIELSSESEEVPTVGDAAPELKVDAPEGVVLDWSSLRGEVVVLEFWATWCAPCIPALDHLGALAREFEGEDLRFLSVSPETPERMERFLATRELEFPVLLDRENATFDAYGVRVVPTTIIVDREGKVAARTRPGEVTAEVLRRVLEGQPAGLEVLHDVEMNTAWVPEDSEEGEVFARVVIAPSESRSGGHRFQPGSGQITGDGIHRNNMIQIAYDVPNTRLINRLRPWSSEDPVYKLSVLAPGGDDDLARRMLARTVEVKFQLRAEFQELERDVYVLTRDEDAYAWAESEAEEGDRTGSASGGGVHFVGQPMQRACDWFENILQRPIIDQTGLTGRYDVEMEWVDGSGFQAELARLGLKLTAELRPIRCLVVEPAR